MIKVPKRVLTLARLHVSQDVTRPHLNGVCFERDGEGTRAIATDGHRLIAIEWDEFGTELRSLPPSAETAFAPVWLLDAAKEAFLDRDAYYIGENRIEPVPKDEKDDPSKWAVRSISYLSDGFESRCSPWRHLVYARPDAKITLDVAALKALKFTGQGAILEFGQDRKVRFIERLHEDQPEARDHGVIGEITEGVPGCDRITLNGGYLRDALKALRGTKDATLDVCGELDPVIFRGGSRDDGVTGVMVLVMPMRQ